MEWIDYLGMKTDEEAAAAATALLDSDFTELKITAKTLISHAAINLSGRAVGTSFLRRVASFAAIGVRLTYLISICIYLLILDRTNWRTNMLTSLLIPFIFFSFPQALFHFLR